MFLRTGTLVALLLLFGYGILEVFPLLSGPRITLTSPTDGESFADGFARIQGVTTHTEDLSLNGTPLLIDEKGRFSTTLVLPHGGAILSLTATDRFGKTENVRRTIFVP